MVRTGAWSGAPGCPPFETHGRFSWAAGGATMRGMKSERVHSRISILVAVGCLALLARGATAQSEQGLVRRAELVELHRASEIVRVTVRASELVDRDYAELILLDGALSSVARLQFDRESPQGWVYLGTLSPSPPLTSQPLNAPPPGGSLHAYWLDSSGLRTQLATAPVAGDFFTTVNAVGPGNQSVWINAGAQDGARVGDGWWLRVNGQPAARFETLLVAARLSFARVTPLAADVPLWPGQRVAVWPNPLDERLGHLRSAVARVEMREALCIAWIARPPGAALTGEMHVEFKRGGATIALGALERSDALFAHVRVIAQFLPSQSNKSPGQACCAVQVGDSVEFRTPADIQAGRYLVRLFAPRTGEFLINAGEPESIERGASGAVFRNGQPVGRARIERVQSGYSVIRPETSAVEFAVGDVFQLQPSTVSERLQGQVERVVAGRLLDIRPAADSTLATNDLIALYDGGEVVALACIVDAIRGGRAAAVVLEATQVRPVTVGAAVVGQ